MAFLALHISVQANPHLLFSLKAWPSALHIPQDEHAEQLRATAFLAALVAGFDLVALIQFSFEAENQDPSVLLCFGITNALTVRCSWVSIAWCSLLWFSGTVLRLSADNKGHWLQVALNTCCMSSCSLLLACTYKIYNGIMSPEQEAGYLLTCRAFAQQ